MPASRFRRPLIVGSVALLALLAAPVAADRPTRTIEPPPEDFVLAAGEACPFAVLVHIGGGAFTITFTDAGQNPVRQFSARLSGTLEVTNLETGKTVVVNDAGPGFIEFHPDGSFTLVGVGPWGFPIDPDTGEPGLFRVMGRFVMTFDAAGNVTSFEFVGAVKDLCAALAD